jgi:hypothetical protein
MTPVAERVRAYRSRKKSGAAVLPFVQVGDEIGTVEMLVSAHLLAEHRRDDPAAIATAVGKLIDAMVRETNWS